MYLNTAWFLSVKGDNVQLPKFVDYQLNNYGAMG